MRDSQGGLGSFSVSTRLLGVSVYVAWIEVIYSSQAFVPSARFGQDAAVAIFPLSTLGLALGLVLMALLPRLTERLCESRWFTYAVGFVGALCTLGACMPGYLPADWCFVALAFGTGVCTSAIAMRCATVLVDFDSRTAIMALAAFQLVGIFVFSFAMSMAAYAGQYGAIVVLCLLLPLAAVLLEHDDGRVPYDRAVGAPALPGSFWRIVGVLSLLGFGTCLVRGFFPNFMSGGQFVTALWATACAAVVVMAAIMLWASTVARSAPYGTLCYRMLLAVTGVSAFLLAFGLDSTAAGVIATVLFMVTLLIAWAILLRISFKTGAPVVSVFGFGFGAVAAGCDAGFVFGHRLAVSGLEVPAMAGAALVTVLACIVVALALLRASRFEDLMEPAADGDDELFGGVACTGAPEDGELAPDLRLDAHVAAEIPDSACSPDDPEGGRTPFRRRCDRIALEYGLSAREAEVLHLMAKSCDAKAIADALFVSYNTARSHIRNIYAKMDVHSRHEFFDVVNEPRWRS